MLSGSLAQQIARDTSDVIGYNVLITDDAGVVIGSGDTSRIGSFHEASVEVLRSRQAAWHTAAEAQELRGVKPGMTLPILIDGLSAVPGSCGTYETRRPRRRRSSCSSRPAISSPATRTLPDTIRSPGRV